MLQREIKKTMQFLRCSLQVVGELLAIFLHSPFLTITTAIVQPSEALSVVIIHNCNDESID